MAWSGLFAVIYIWFYKSVQIARNIDKIVIPKTYVISSYIKIPKEHEQTYSDQ